VYEHAAATVFHATQFSAGVHITHATSLLRVSKNTEFANAVAIGAPLKRQLPPQVRQENAVASPNQYAGRPGVPTACVTAHAEPLKHADTVALHVNNFAISVFD
jgi:hypothetical protein